MRGEGAAVEARGVFVVARDDSFEGIVDELDRREPIGRHDRKQGAQHALEADLDARVGRDVTLKKARQGFTVEVGQGNVRVVHCAPGIAHRARRAQRGTRRLTAPRAR